MDDPSLKEQVDKLESKVGRLQDILRGILTLLGHVGYKANTIVLDEQNLTIIKKQLDELYNLD